MAKSLTHISIFLASPSDLVDERKAVATAVLELNSILRTTLNVCLDLIGWETHAYPSAGTDAQAVINQQIGTDYDIFIGLMWGRFGTVTGRAGSGTEEEFDLAYQKHTVSHGKAKVMVYFSTQPINPDDVDVEQLVKVREFKKKASELGILHWQFSSGEELGQLLKIHLPNHIKDILNEEVMSFDKELEPKDANDSNISLNDFVELGYLDYMEIFNGNFKDIEGSLNNMTDYLNDLTASMHDKTDKINALINSGGASNRESIIILDKFAKDALHYVNKNKIEINRFHDLYTEGINAFTTAFAMSVKMNDKNDVNELMGFVESIFSTNGIISGATKSIKKLKRQVNAIPPMSKNLIGAVKILDNILNRIVKEFSGCEKMMSELADVIEDRILMLQNENDGSSSAILED